MFRSAEGQQHEVGRRQPTVDQNYCVQAAYSASVPTKLPVCSALQRVGSVTHWSLRLPLGRAPPAWPDLTRPVISHALACSWGLLDTGLLGHRPGLGAAACGSPWPLGCCLGLTVTVVVPRTPFTLRHRHRHHPRLCALCARSVQLLRAPLRPASRRLRLTQHPAPVAPSPSPSWRPYRAGDLRLARSHVKHCVWMAERRSRGKSLWS